MSKAILAAVRPLQQLKGSLLLTALELAHRADGYNGTCRVSYSFLASKTRLHPRTMMRHISELVRLKIIRCQRFKQHGKQWLTNCYIFCIPWKRPLPAHMSPIDKVPQKFPTARREEKNRDLERGKWGTIADEERREALVLSWLTPGSEIYGLVKGEKSG